MNSYPHSRKGLILLPVMFAAQPPMCVGSNAEGQGLA